MKTRFLIIALISVFLFSCTSKVVKETAEAYADGSPKLVRFYKDDGQSRVLIKETYYYPNHQKYMEGSYKDNKRDGNWSSWWQNGNIWSEGSFKDGLDDGKRNVYYENGKKLYEGHYTAGQKTGVWKFYDDKGNFTKDETYGNGAN